MLVSKLSFFDTYRKYLNEQHIRHLALNYSWRSSCMRHPENPTGVMIRDEGQVQLYAGKTQSILAMSGDRLDLSTNHLIISEKLGITTKGITNLKILGKNFTKELFNGQKVVAIKPNASISKYFVMDATTRVVPETGEIINKVPMGNIFDERLIFEIDSVDKNLLPPTVEILELVRGLKWI